jgi:hypothetical protein
LADLLPIEVDPVLARAIVETVPFWFHRFALNRAEGIFMPGSARDRRYRVSALPEDFAGMSVLDVGRFDGFHAFLTERRGGPRRRGGGQRAVSAAGLLPVGRRAGGRGGLQSHSSIARLGG